MSLPTHAPLKGIKGLRKGSVVLLEQVRIIDKKRLDDFAGTLSRQVMLKVDAALREST
ncbi:type II toxin-antitoxin system PemK/MazF family toxin [Roseburia hominis]